MNMESRKAQPIYVYDLSQEMSEADYLSAVRKLRRAKASNFGFQYFSPVEVPDLNRYLRKLGKGTS